MRAHWFGYIAILARRVGGQRGRNVVLRWAVRDGACIRYNKRFISRIQRLFVEVEVPTRKMENRFKPIWHHAIAQIGRATERLVITPTGTTAGSRLLVDALVSAWNPGAPNADVHL